MGIAILDIDGTLVDTNYHHALAWSRAFRQHGLVLPIWQIHRHIGMGGDQLVTALTDERTEEKLGDEIRAAQGILYAELIGEVEPMAGARALIEELHQRGHEIVLASSAQANEVDHYLELLGARGIADSWTSADDVEKTKPAPDLVLAALDSVDGKKKDAVMIGDSTWDVKAAKAAGIATIGVLTGGFAETELDDAGAAQVFSSVEELRLRLGETALA
jgi:HAD superfamily hydrolase (TIGR01509 family)